MRDIVRILEDDEENEDREVSEQVTVVTKKKRGALKGPGIVAMLALGVEITDEQYVLPVIPLTCLTGFIESSSGASLPMRNKATPVGRGLPRNESLWVRGYADLQQ